MPSAGKKLAIGSNVALSILLALALVVILNVLSARHFRISDWTSTGEFTLSEKTLNILERLDKPVEIAVFLPPSDEMGRRVTSLLKQYEAHGGGKVLVHLPRSEADLEELKLKRSFPVPSPKDPELRVAVRCGDRIEKIPERKLGQRSTQGNMYEPPRPHKFSGEAALTYAIRAVTEGAQKTVCFVAGHGERTPAHLKQAAKALAEENLLLKDVDLLKDEISPASVQVLVVAGPEHPFRPEEISRIEGFLAAGGRCAFLLQPFSTDEKKGAKPSGLERMLDAHGILVGNEIVYEPHLSDPNQGFYVVIPTMPIGVRSREGEIMNVQFCVERAHPVTAPLTRADPTRLLFPAARPLEAKKSAKEPQSPYEPPDPSAPTLLVKTSQDALAVYDLAAKGFADSPTTRKGTFALAMAVSRPAAAAAAEGRAETRIVAVGNATFVEDQVIEQFPANQDLFVNIVNWLADREESLGIGPKSEGERLVIRLGSEEARRWVSWTCLLAPVAVMVLGLAVWILRKS